MNKPRVLMVGPDRSVHGGISGVVNMYYDAGLSEHIELKYIGTMKEGSKIYKLLVALVAFFRFMLCVNRYDIVHVNVASDRSFDRKMLFVNAAYHKHKVIVLHHHGGDFINWYNGCTEKKKKKIRLALDRADKILVLAPLWKEFLGKLTDSNKIMVFPNGIPIEDNQVSSEIYLRNKDYDNQKILFLGRICESKGINELLFCASKLEKTYPKAKILLGGIFEDKSLEEEVLTKHPNVEYLGWLTSETKRKYLNESAIFVMPSYFEGQCIAIVEAMAAGCLIVASNTGGIPMMIHDVDESGTGILVSPKNSEDLLLGIYRALENRELRRLRGVNARTLAVNDYDIEKNIISLLRVYNELINCQCK